MKVMNILADSLRFGDGFGWMCCILYTGLKIWELTGWAAWIWLSGTGDKKLDVPMELR